MSSDNQQAQDKKASWTTNWELVSFLVSACRDAHITIGDFVSKVESGEIDDTIVEVYLTAQHRLQHELEVLKAQYEQKRSPYMNELNQLEFQMANRIEEYCVNKMRGEGKKTFAFWSGTATIRRYAPRLDLVSDEEAIAYLRENGFEHMMNQSVRKSDFLRYANDLMKDSGELVPGVELTPEKEMFNLRAGAKKEVPDGLGELDPDSGS